MAQLIFASGDIVGSADDIVFLRQAVGICGMPETSCRLRFDVKLEDGPD